MSRISIIKILSPKHIPSRKTSWNRRTCLYYKLLGWLLPIYRRSAISDSIKIGEIQLIHNLRDYSFEQELQRFCIDTAQHLEKSSAPFNTKRRFLRSYLFCWSESLLIFHEGKSYAIKRDRNFSIATDIIGTLKISTNRDFILRSEFIAKNTREVQRSIRNNVTGSIQDEQPIVETAHEDKPKQKISIRDSVPSVTSSLEPKLKKYQGFEENSIF